MKVTTEQKYILLDFIEANENIAKNRLANNFTAKDAAKLWIEVGDKLNACNGPKKTWKAWRKCWQDIKCASKAKAAAYRNEGRQTGGGAPKENEPSSFQKRVITLIGKNAIHGHSDVEESTIILEDELNSPLTPSAIPVIFEVDINTFPEETQLLSQSMPAISSTFNMSTSQHENTPVKTSLLTPQAKISNPRKRNLIVPEQNVERNEEFFKMQREIMELKREKLKEMRRRMEEERMFREKMTALKERKIKELKRIGDYLEKIQAFY